MGKPLIVDNFAGGGGASTGIEMALGSPIDFAINHDPKALAMHQMNHPNSVHVCQNMYTVDPLELIGRRHIGLAWFSPDCKHFSKAKGGKPVQRNIRDLAWAVVPWAERVKPDVIMLENVEEFLTWCPLDENDQPDFSRKGETFRKWLKALKKAGYKVEYRILRACDYGAPTIRKRLFVIARRDGRAIVWPEPTHGAADDADVISGLKKPWLTAADCIDWSIPCPSIFATREEIKAEHGLSAVRPLAPKTMDRIGRGIDRYVLKDGRPFIVQVQNGSNPSGVRSIDDPMLTVTAHPKGGGMALVAPFMMHLKGSKRSARSITEPLPAITAGGMHQAMVCAFLIKYYGSGVGQKVSDPFHTVTTRERFGLVTVEIRGEKYAIYDIGMRMLTSRELFRAQGFPEDYKIEAAVDGKKLTKAEIVAKCGNSVCPPMAQALVEANCQHLMKMEIAA